MRASRARTAVLVLDQQDGAVRRSIRSAALGVAAPPLAATSAGDLLAGSDMARQEDAEGRALADARIDEDEAAGLLDDAVDHGEAEPGALADLLGGEEGLEDLVDDLRRDAGAGVLDLEQRRSRPRGRPCKPKAARSRSAATLPVRTVSLPPLGMASRALTARLTMTCSNWWTIGLDRPEVAAVADVELDLVADARRFSSSERSDSTSPRSSTCGRSGLPAREGEQLPHQAGRRGWRSA